MLIILAVALSGTTGCDGGQDGITGDGGGDTDGRILPPNPLGDRANPLQEYIRTYWTDGDPVATGGFRRGHIKIYGHCYTDFANTSDAGDQAQFIADNYDAYMWGGTIVGDYMAGLNSLWLVQATDIPHIGSNYDSLMIARWLADPDRNTGGYRFDDMIMHYKYDVETWIGSTPGWNPRDDRDGDLCRDRPPSDPDRTAQCFWQAEVRTPNFWHDDQFQRRAKVMHPAYIGYVVDSAVDMWRDVNCDGFHFDSATYENWSLELGETFLYEGEDETDPDFPLRTDLLTFVPTAVDAMENKMAGETIHFANTVTPYYSCRIPRSKELCLEYVENTHNETWMETDVPDAKAMTMARRADYLDCPYLDWMEQDKGYIFACFNKLGSDRGKRFSLSVFYLINHQMAFYYYRTDEHRVADGEHVRDKQFNPYVDFDIGQPAVNSQGLADFQGNTGTDRYFVMATDEHYEILGREYLRGDGQRTLILVKLMADGRSEGTSPMLYTLPRAFRVVQPDLSLGDPVTEIQLLNNDGVILVEDGS